MKIIKNNGEWAVFEPENLKYSLRKSGAEEVEVEEVYTKISRELYQGITTREIYNKAFSYLKDLRKSYASKYSLKKALSDLGPTGYYFEKWVCHLLKYMGYISETGHILKGRSISHEIDVLARRGEEILIAECKLRNTSDAKISVTTPMYYLSRIKDLSGLDFKCFDSIHPITEGWLITNAYFTKDSISFSEYYGIKLLSWDYPQNNSISQLTDESHLYPITCLTELNSTYKKQLLDADIILVQDILDRQDSVKKIIDDKNAADRLINEVQELIHEK